MTDPVLERTRRGLHAVAELVLAGPQFRTSDSIELRVSPGGFRTLRAPQLSVVGVDVVADGRSIPICGRTPQALAAAVGVRASGLDDVYHAGSGVALDEELAVDGDAARRIADAFAFGDAAMRLFAPQQEPVLWPEHFDVGIRVEDVNYGVSPGDGYLGEPYAYVGVDPVPADPYWNAPFGRTRPMTEFAAAEAVRDFFADGRDRAPR